MSSNAKHAFGTTLKWNNQPVALLTAINGVEINAEVIDVTSHQSDDNYKEFIAGLLDAGEVTLEGWYDYTDTAGQHAMLTDMNARIGREVIITFPVATGTTWTFDGLITKLLPGGAPTDGAIPFSATIKPSGKPEFAIATSAGLTTTFFAIDESADIVPDPANDVYLYNASVLTGVSSVKLTPIATAGVITVNGNVVATGEASSAITLGDANSVTEITVIVKETNKAPVTYTIWLARAAGA